MDSAGSESAFVYGESGSAEKLLCVQRFYFSSRCLLLQLFEHLLLSLQLLIVVACDGNTYSKR